MDSLLTDLSAASATQKSLKLRIEKKLFDSIKKLIDKVKEKCRSEKLKLVNSPPYIIDILQEIQRHLNKIQIVYEKKMHILNDIEYFQVFCCNLIDKLEKIIDLFKSPIELFNQRVKNIYDENSDERARFTKYTLNLLHMQADLKSMFPDDVYEGQSFQIIKLDAADFWRKNFREKSIVTWDEFENKLNSEHKISSKIEAVKLRRTVQLTDSSFVSIFEFDIFTRLFQPWYNLLNNWKFLATEHPGYTAFSTYEEIKKRLQKFIHKPGSYLYRFSCTKLGQWAIGYVTAEQKILQTIPQSLIEALIEGQNKKTYLYPNGSDIVIDISVAIEQTSATRILTSKEQNESYFVIDSTFELCKICSENDKDRKLEPCGHMICSTCLKIWQDHNVITKTCCPFCRCEIKAYEPIIISPFEYPDPKNNSTSDSAVTLNDDPNNSNNNYLGILRQDCFQLTENNQHSDKSQPKSNLNDGYEIISVNKTSQVNDSDISEKYTNSDSSSSSEISALIQPKTNLNDGYVPISVSTPSKLNDSENVATNLNSSSLEDTIYSITNLIQLFDAPIVTESLKPTKKETEEFQDSKQLKNISEKSNLNTAISSGNQTIQSPKKSSINSLPISALTDASNENISNKKEHRKHSPNYKEQSSSTSLKPSTSLQQNFCKHYTIVKQNEVSDKSLEIKIENSILLDDLANLFGYDKVKVACALLIADNDIKMAQDILKMAS